MEKHVQKCYTNSHYVKKGIYNASESPAEITPSPMTSEKPVAARRNGCKDCDTSQASCSATAMQIGQSRKKTLE